MGAEAYKPTDAEMAAAEATMTDTQKEWTDAKTARIREMGADVDLVARWKNEGRKGEGPLAERKSLSVIAERWPNADWGMKLEGVTKDGERLELYEARIPGIGDRYVAMIDGKEVPELIAKELLFKFVEPAISQKREEREREQERNITRELDDHGTAKDLLD